MTKKSKEEITNSCGPTGFISKLIPNSLIGIDISESCNIHDWMLHNSTSREDFEKADDTFLKNLKEQIKLDKSIFNFIRKGLSYIYYGAVRGYSILKGMLKND